MVPAFLAILQSSLHRIVELKLELPSQEDTLLTCDAPALQAVALQQSYMRRYDLTAFIDRSSTASLQISYFFLPYSKSLL